MDDDEEQVEEGQVMYGLAIPAVELNKDFFTMALMGFASAQAAAAAELLDGICAGFAGQFLKTTQNAAFHEEAAQAIEAITTAPVDE